MSTLYPTVDELRGKLADARAELAAAERDYQARERRDTLNYGDDPAIASGVRRKPNPRADARRFAAYDRTAAACVRMVKAQAEVENLEKRLTRAEKAAPVPFTPEQLKAATAIRWRNGWEKVKRVNTKTVSCVVAPGWNDVRVPHELILEVR